MSEIINVTELKEKLDIFAKKRDWERFHFPKNLAMALSVEASELLEIFQWMTPEESNEIYNDKEKLLHVQEEIADIVNYCIRLSSVLSINLKVAIEDKLKKNELKYPVE